MTEGFIDQTVIFVDQDTGVALITYIDDELEGRQDISSMPSIGETVIFDSLTYLVTDIVHEFTRTSQTSRVFLRKYHKA